MDTSARMLRLLSLLQARPNWTGPELAGRLEVTDRTLRRDITRLRDLGYPVEAFSGPAGGYRLARDARHISAYDVIRALDGPIFLTSCFTEHGSCGHTQKCNVREPLRRVHEGIVRLLENISISEMADEEAGAECMPRAETTVLTTLQGNLV